MRTEIRQEAVTRVASHGLFVPLVYFRRHLPLSGEVEGSSHTRHEINSL